MTTTRSRQPRTPEEGYHLTHDLTDKAIEFIQDAKAIAPDKPFFLYFCPGAAHAPHHAPKEWVGPVQGQVRHGLRGLSARSSSSDRRSWASCPRAPSCRRSTPTSTTRAPTDKSWPELDTVRPWDSLIG